MTHAKTGLVPLTGCPQEALDAVYLFSPHSMLNLRNAVVPTSTLMPRIEATDPRRWKVVGVWKKRVVARDDNDDDDDDDEDDDDADNLLSAMSRARGRGGRRGGGGGAGGGIHDMDLDEGMPMLDGRAEGTDLENVSPVRIEAWMPRVFHYARDADRTGDTTVHRKMFCVLTVTPVRNLNLAEYMRHTVVENTQVNRLWSGLGPIFPWFSRDTPVHRARSPPACPSRPRSS